MKTIALIILMTLIHQDNFAQTRMQLAKKEATEQKKIIVLNFSGSDWCIPCIKMHQQIIESDTFQKLKSENILVYVNADFPRGKNHLNSNAIQLENVALAEQYNPKGMFPFTLLLDSTGRILREWNGLPKESAVEFTDEILKYYHQIQ